MCADRIKNIIKRPSKMGLYDPQFEKDSCGVGLVANIKGIPSREIMEDAYIINSRMDHRGGCGFEENTGDGAGILMALPDKFFQEEAKKLNFTLPEKDFYAVGNIFLPQQKKYRQKCKLLIEQILKTEKLNFIGWREVPVDADKEFFLWLEKNLSKILSLSPQFIEKAIKRSIEIKAEIVFQDEKEKGLRAILNFGHTFGHALETAGENKIYSHGEAVGLGMLTATKLSEIVLGLKEEYSNSIYKVIKNSGMKVNLKQKVSTKKLIKLMQSDKKKKDGEIQFILLEKIGQATIRKVKKIDLVEKAIKKSLFY